MLVECLFCHGVADLQEGIVYKYCKRKYCAVCKRWLKSNKDFHVVGKEELEKAQDKYNNGGFDCNG